MSIVIVTCIGILAQAHFVRNTLQSLWFSKMAATSTTCTLIPLSGGKSKAWKHFRFKVDEKSRKMDNKQVICRICMDCFPYCGNMMNLLYHLHTCHKEEYNAICPTPTVVTGSSGQTTLSSYVAASKPYVYGSARFQQCEDLLLRLICKDMLSMSIVDSKYLRSFIDMLDHRYKPSSRTHFLSLNSCKV